MQVKLRIESPRTAGFSVPNRLDRNRKGGGYMIYVRDDILSKMLAKHNLPEDIEAAFIELNFRKCKSLLCGTYRYQTSINWFYLYLSYILQKRRLRRYHTGILEILKRSLNRYLHNP